jgi:hypothetical protein
MASGAARMPGAVSQGHAGLQLCMAADVLEHLQAFLDVLRGVSIHERKGAGCFSMRSAVLAGLAGSALCLTLDGAIGVAQVLEPYLNPDPETAPPAVRPHSVAVLWKWSGMRCIRVCVCVCVFTRMQTIA